MKLPVVALGCIAIVFPVMAQTPGSDAPSPELPCKPFPDCALVGSGASPAVPVVPGVPIAIQNGITIQSIDHGIKQPDIAKALNSDSFSKPTLKMLSPSN